MNVRLVEVLVSRLPGVRLVVAPTGREGLAAARAERPDLILLDVRLPDMSGEEVLGLLARDELLAGVPVFAVTADDDEVLRQRLLASGARCVISKPFDVQALNFLLENEFAPGEAPPGTLDRRAVEALRALPKARRLVADFIDESRQLVGRMGCAADDHDAATLADLGHRLSGVAGTFGASRLGLLCAAIEGAASAGNLEEASRLVDGLVEELEQVAAELRDAFA